METLIGIDLGVSFVKAGLYTADGECMCAVKEPAPGEHRGQDVFIQGADDYFAVVLKVLSGISREKPAESKKAASVTISGQMAGSVGIDREWNDLTTCSSNMDCRYTPYVEEMIAANREGMSSLTGTNYPYWGAKLLWWKKEFPDLYKKIERFVFLGGFIAGKLCGLGLEEAFADRSYLVMTGLADVKNNRWSDELCGSFGLDKKTLPQIVRSSDVVGRVSGETAAACGLTAGVPVVAGAGDKTAGALGAGLTKPGMMVDESASFGALTLGIDTFIPDTRFGILELMASPIEGLYYPTSFLLGSGITLAWFLKMVTGKESVSSAEFAEIESKAAALPPGSEGMSSAELKRDFGDKLCFHGGIDLQEAMPGTREDVRREVECRIDAFGPGGGYILNPANHIQNDTPAENIVELYRYAKEYGTYPLKGAEA